MIDLTNPARYLSALGIWNNFRYFGDTGMHIVIGISASGPNDPAAEEWARVILPRRVAARPVELAHLTFSGPELVCVHPFSPPLEKCPECGGRGESTCPECGHTSICTECGGAGSAPTDAICPICGVRLDRTGYVRYPDAVARGAQCAYAVFQIPQRPRSPSWTEKLKRRKHDGSRDY